MTNTIRIGDAISALDAPPTQHAFSGVTQENISSAMFVPGSPEVSCTFVAPTSGRVLVAVGGGLRDNGGTNRVHLGLELREDDASGALLMQAAAARNSWTNASTNTANYQYGSRILLLPLDADGFATALTPGATYFARAMHSINGGSTGDITFRDLTVASVPLGHPYGAAGGFTLAGQRPPPAGVAEVTTQANVSATVAARDPGNPQVVLEFIAPASGRALIVTSGGFRDNASTGRVMLYPEVRLGGPTGPLLFNPGQTVHGVSEAFRFAVSSSSAQTGAYQYLSRVGLLGVPSTEPLIPGRLYHVQLYLSTSGGGTTDIRHRDVMVIPVS
jgi:hypothetical protein